MTVAELPAGWREVQLGAITAMGSGGTPRAGSSRYYEGGDVPWAVIGDLNDGIVAETRQHITVAAIVESSAKVVPPGTVLLAMYGSIGKLGIAAVEMATNQAIATLQPHPDVVTSRWLFWTLMAQRDALMSRGVGATQRNISQTLLRPWPVLLPPLDEQHRIVAVLEDHLSRLDAAGAYLQGSSRRSAALLPSLVLSRMLGQADNAQSARAAVVQDAGELPRPADGWTWSRLGQLADVVGGITKDSGKQSADDLVEVPYLRVANVQRGRLDLSVMKSIRAPRAKAEALRLMPGDVLMNEGGDRDKLGRGWVWSGEIDGCIHQNHVFRARPHNGVIRPALLSWWTNTVGGEWCERHGRQSVNLASISLRRIRAMPVPLPPLAVQHVLEQEITESLVAASRLAADVAAATTRTARLRSAVLAAACTGALC